MKPASPGTDRRLILNTIFFISGFLFIAIALFTYMYPVNLFDNYVQGLIHTLATPAALTFWIHISFFGSFEFLFPVWVISILVWVWQRKPRFGISMAGVAIGGFLSVQIIKILFRRHRPPTPLIPAVSDYSFPSGHSTSSFIFCAVLSYSVWHMPVARSLRVSLMCLLIMLTLLIGLSRVVLYVHYPTDVAAGFCFGMVWFIVWYRFVKAKKLYI